MAYGRRYWRRYYRRYYRGRYGRYSSYGKTKMSRNFKASAANMTQGGTFNISVHSEKELAVPAPAQGQTTSFKYDELDLAKLIAQSDMHNYLSNVFDQYRVEKVVVRIRPAGNSNIGQGATTINPSILFSCVDRSGFTQNLPLTTLRTYGSYKETQVSGDKDVSPTHYIYIGASNLVEFSTYSDTKNKVSFPAIVFGAFFANLGGNITCNFSIECDCQVRYRGVRLDTRQVQPNDPTNVFDLTINSVNVYQSITSTGVLNEVAVTRITGTTFTLSNTDYNYIYAVKVAGDNAYKEIRAAMVYGSQGGVLEFENNLAEYNLYKGTVPNNQSHEALQDMKLKITFNGGMNTTVICPEAQESAMPLSIDQWPVVYEFNSE